jgi:hypothetical protein
MLLEGLHDERLDREHDPDEGQRVGEKQGDVEKLEGAADLEANAVRPTHQLDNENDLPDER